MRPRSSPESSRFMVAGPVDIHAGERAPQPRPASLPNPVGFCLGIRNPIRRAVLPAPALSGIRCKRRYQEERYAHSLL